MGETLADVLWLVAGAGLLLVAAAIAVRFGRRPRPSRGDRAAVVVAYCCAASLGGFLVTRSATSLSVVSRSYVDLAIRPKGATASSWEVVRLEARGSEWGLDSHAQRSPSRRVTLVVTRRDGASTRLCAVNSDGAWRTADATDHPLDDRCVSAWLEDSGLPPGDEVTSAVRALVARNLTLLLKDGALRTLDGPYGPVALTGYSGWRIGAPPWIPGACVAIAGMGGLAGLWRLVRGGRGR